MSIVNRRLLRILVRGQSYRFPAEATVWLKKLTAGLRPLRVHAPPRSC